MWTNYLTLACRNLLKHKFFSFINIAGLATGIAACLLILQFVSFELSYDDFHTKGDRTYRVINDRYQNGRRIQQGPMTYPAVSPAMAEDFEEVEAYSLTRGPSKINIKAGDEIFRSDDFLFADEHFFSVFDFRIIAGQQAQPLREPFTAVLTESTAKRYFGESDMSKVLGKEIYKGPEPQPYRVTAIISDVPINSHLQFDLLLSFASQMPPGGYKEEQRWRVSNVRHYVVLKPGTDHRAVEAKMAEFSERYFRGDQMTGSTEKFSLQPLLDIHLYSAFDNDFIVKASGKAVWAMLIVAGFILVIAWINYINLTTSKAMERAKEVGLRKVMGAMKLQLIRQFVFEAVVLISFAVLLALILALVLQKPFNTLVGANLSLLNMFSSWDVWMITAMAMVLAGGTLLAGFYPAFVLSSYQPATVLKGKFQHSSAGQMLRKGLVVFQFTASCALITGTLIVSRQLAYMNEKDLGMRVNDIVIVGNPVRTPWDSTFIDKARMFKHTLRQLPQVMDAATGGQHPGSPLFPASGIRIQDQPDTEYTMGTMAVDEDYFSLYEIKLMEGRTFVTTDFSFDWRMTNTAVINKKACELIGVEPEQAVGKKFANGSTIIGVVSDFHQKSLHHDIEPVIFVPKYDRFHYTAIKLQAGSNASTIAMIKKEYEKFFPDNGFEFQFVSERFNEPYKDDNRFSSVITIFTGMAIFISCLGLIGLSSYTALQRTKEIGIRKVLGASVMNIVSLLSSDFIKLVLIACMLSLPLAYMGAGRWLVNYPYRITPGFLFYALPVIVILAIAVITISVQIIKTAQRDPVQSLKHE